MKYRNDFVTNSSSSSFIVSFKNKADMEEQFKNMVKRYPLYAEMVFQDINQYRKTYTETLNDMKERLGWEARYHVRYEMPEYANKRYDYEWVHSEEFEKAKKKYIDEELEKFKKRVNHRGIFAMVTYSDHDNSELEHRIMPRMPFTVKTFSNH